MIKNEKHSHKDYLNQSLKHFPSSDFSNTIIVNTCFAQENCTDTVTQIDIFPDDTTNVHFVDCNLINVYIPPTCTIERGSVHKELSSESRITNVDLDENLSKEFVQIKTKTEYLASFEFFKWGVK